MRTFANPLTGRPCVPRRLMLDASGHEPGPLTLLLCGVHGNEPSGWLAIDAVAEVLHPARGRVVGVCVNLAAVDRGVRYVERDANRLWGPPDSTVDGRELAAAMDVISSLLDHEGPRFFLDCHSVSSESVPFLSVLGEASCAEFAGRLPAHAVIGAGDHLPGVSDRWLFERGFIGCTSEAGHHGELATMEAQESMIWCALAATGNVSDEHPLVRRSRSRLSRVLLDGAGRYEVVHVHRIEPGESFAMRPGWFNFRRVSRGEVLAEQGGEDVFSPTDGRIYMPLYQPQGTVGFSIVEGR